MKINTKHFAKNVNFDMIEEGDAFIFHEDYYMRIHAPDSEEFNAVNLKNGMGEWFDENDVVEPVDVTICLTKEIN
jgi:hypothetical protein